VGGIIGKLSFEHDETLAVPALEQMLATLRHRGSTGQGIHIAPGIALGWCGHDHAPLNHPAVATNWNDTVRVVADSSLTNADTLRRELERSGHVVHGRADADLIVHAYDEWGDACVERLRGPFACALWDQRRERLLLARDSMGRRPLFFAVLHGHGVVFASEIRALLQDPGVGREWSPQAIDAYLALGYIPAPLTAYRRISKLEPAQRLIVEGRRFHLDQFWDLPAATTVAESDLAEALDGALGTAIRRHVGNPDATATLYSGGAASTAILAGSPAGVGAVLVASLDDERETERALAASRQLGIEPRVEFTVPEGASLALSVAAQFDEPVGDPCAISEYAVLLAARTSADSALAGHGARTLWPQLRRSRTPDVDQDTLVWNAHQRRGLYTRGFAWQVRDADPLAVQRELLNSQATDDAFERALYVDVRLTLPERTVARAERLALSAGLELHLPFLDRDVVELSRRCRAQAGRPTAMDDPLMAMLARRIPSTLLPPPAAFPGRSGRATRTATWLPSALAAMVPSILLGPRFDGRGIVSRPAVRRLCEEHTAGCADHSHRLWSLLMLEFWFREFVDGDTAVDEPFEYAILRAA
jgi:asparagine synthase (glutamine-hydrolysing)